MQRGGKRRGSGVTDVACDCCGSSEWTFLFTQGAHHLGTCPSCRLLYVQPMPKASQRMTEMEAGHFAGTEEVLRPDAQLESEKAQASTLRRYVDLTQKFAPTGRWLDIGCGAGVLMSIAQKVGYKTEGIELTTGRRELARTVTGAQIHSEPIEDLGIADGSYNVVSLINVFSHLTMPSTTLREIARVLKPGGVVLLVTGVVGGSVKREHVWNWSLGDHLYFLGEGTLQRYAKQVGWAVAHEERTWAPRALMTREHLAVKGRSRARNAVKALLLGVPGAFPLARKAFLRYHANNVVYSSLFVLQGNEPGRHNAS